jgi:hypothetical protein
LFQLGYKTKGIVSSLLIEPTNRKADVDDDIVPWGHVGNVGKVDPTYDASERHLTDAT